MIIPFNIGDTYWKPVTSPVPVNRPCPICDTKRFVKIVLGNGDIVPIECQACDQYDYGRAHTGYIRQFEYDPGATEFVIDGIESFYVDRWSVRSTTLDTANFEELCTSYAQAIEASTKRCEAFHEENMRRLEGSRRNANRLTWSARYHQMKIKEHERSIEWHRSKLSTPKEQVDVSR